MTIFDRRVLAACGAAWAPPDSHPEPAAAGFAGAGEGGKEAAGGDGGPGGGGVFVYAPGCPHAVNSDLLESYLDWRPERFAYLGSCAELYEAIGDLRASDRRQRGGGASGSGSNGESGRSEGGGGGGEGGANSSAAAGEADDGGCGCARGLRQGGGGGGASGWEGVTRLAQLRAAGRLLELPLPEGGVGHLHGADTRLHVFLPEPPAGRASAEAGG